MTILSQRDTRWASKKIGKTSKTIGDYGCTITALAMLAGLNPDEVNDRLTRVGGFQGALILWSKVKEAIPWLEFEWRGYAYDNERVAEAINRNGGCLVEADFDGLDNTRDSHWVLFVGNQRLYDPWTGRESATSKYTKYTGFAVVNKAQEVPVEGEERVELGKAKFEELVTKASKYDGFMAKGWESPGYVEQLLSEVRQSAQEAKDAQTTAEGKRDEAIKQMDNHLQTLADKDHLDTAIDWKEAEDKAKGYGKLQSDHEELQASTADDKKAWSITEQELKARIKVLEERLSLTKEIKAKEIREALVASIKEEIARLKSYLLNIKR